MTTTVACPICGYVTSFYFDTTFYGKVQYKFRPCNNRRAHDEDVVYFVVGSRQGLLLVLKEHELTEIFLKVQAEKKEEVTNDNANPKSNDEGI